MKIRVFFIENSRGGLLDAVEELPLLLRDAVRVRVRRHFAEVQHPDAAQQQVEPAFSIESIICIAFR